MYFLYLTFDMALKIKIDLKAENFLQELKDDIKNEMQLSEYSVIKTKPLRIPDNGIVDVGITIKGAIITAQLIDISSEDIDQNGNIKNNVAIIVEDIVATRIEGSKVAIASAVNRYVILTFLAGD